MKPGPVRPILVSLILLGAHAMVACAEKGGTTESDGSTGESSSGSTSTASTASTASSDPGTTGGVATVTSETNPTQDTECGSNTCSPCSDSCTAKDTCVDGEWKCECVECEVTTDGTTDSSSTGSGAQGCAADPPQFPEFDRSCADDSECTIVFHQVDCCGTLVAWGLSSAVGKMFGEAETQCQMEYGQCECAAMPTTADDGKVAEDPALIVVACVDSMCGSSVP